jgi:hypothetical protein
MTYLLKGTTGAAHDGVALETGEILRQVANGLPTSQPDSFDDDPSAPP